MEFNKIETLLKKKIKNNIVDYGCKSDCNLRILIKKIGKWRITIDYDGNGYLKNDLMIDDGYTINHMNIFKAFDDPFILPLGVRNWCEQIGIKYLNCFFISEKLEKAKKIIEENKNKYSSDAIDDFKGIIDILLEGAGSVTNNKEVAELLELADFEIYQENNKLWDIPQLYLQ